ncbi:alpha/beta fold hydrolase [Raineyella sp. W15-4]|uniref:alpha/beta fold hydrolase n=1 Tax=Raineyella sp. W15-4 TaxID=3081651 RepID=UPI002954AF29|nr:alpha/beta fold hydrolase [Raineyella sp. W15-4]WOQ17253.1 alpha/beta fold hydrolase [Raineyella sp. W15-4]
MTAAITGLQTRRIRTGGFGTSYVEAGSGARALLLLHGSGPGVSALANWNHNIPALADNFHVVAPDIVGYGDTERPRDIIYSLRVWTDHVWAFLDALGLQQVAIVGNSLGGRIALEMAHDAPERVERMVLMGSPGLGMFQTEGLTALRAYDPSPENMEALLKEYFAVDKSIITRELVERRYAASQEPGAHEAYRLMFFDPRHRGNELGVTEEQVRATRTRTLVIHGREDRVVPKEVGWTMANTLPNADLHMFAHCGHWTQIERSGHFNAVVTTFLQEA